MSFKFSERSKKELATCHYDLQRLAEALILKVDFAVLKGERGEAEQNKAFAEGFSKLRYPLSKHNRKPSLAFDLAPTPIDWKNTQRFIDFGEIVMDTAKELDIKIRWGREFKFKDLPHFEMITE